MFSTFVFSSLVRFGFKLKTTDIWRASAYCNTLAIMFLHWLWFFPCLFTIRLEFIAVNYMHSVFCKLKLA